MAHIDTGSLRQTWSACRCIGRGNVTGRPMLLRPPSASKVAAEQARDEATERSSQPTSSSGRVAVSGQTDKATRQAQRSRSKPATAWESGYNSADAAAIKFLDMGHMAAEYQATVFPDLVELDAATSELRIYLHNELRECKTVEEVLAVVQRDSAVMGPSTAVLAMRMLADCWARDRQAAASTKSKKQRSDQGQKQGQGQGGTQRLRSGSSQAQVDAALSALLSRLAAEADKVRVEQVASALFHMGRAGFTPTSPPPQSQPQARQPTSIPPSAAAAASGNGNGLSPGSQQQLQARRWAAGSIQSAPQYYPAPSGTACVAVLLHQCQPDLFLASPECLGRLAQGLGYLAQRAQQQANRPSGSGAGPASGPGAGGVLPAVQAMAPQPWLQAFCKVAQSKFPMMSAQQLAQVGWGIAQLEHLPDPFWVSGFIARTRACIQEASPTTLAYLTWLLMHMDRMARSETRWMSDYQQYNSLWDEGPYTGSTAGSGQGSTASGQLPSGQAGGTASRGGSAGGASSASGWTAVPGEGASGGGSSGAVGIVDQDWADAVWEGVSERLERGHVNTQTVAMLLHGMSVMGLRPSPGVLQLLGTYLEQRGEHASPMQDCQVLGALARWGQGLSQATMASYLRHIHARLPSYTATDLHLILWALSALGPQPFLPPRPWLATWLACAKPALRGFGAVGIVTVLKSFSTWQLCPPKEFMHDVLEVSAGLARARMLSARQLSQVMRGVSDLRFPLPVDPQEPDRPPRWSREVLTAFAGMAGTAGPAELAVVCFCLPQLLRPARQRRQSSREGSGLAEVGVVGGVGEVSMASSGLGSSDGPSGEGAADEGSAGADGVASSDRRPGQGPAGDRPRTATLHPLVSQAVTAIADASAGGFGSMTGRQLVGVVTGLAAVQFPASAAWMDAHARALVGRAPELGEWQMEAVERSYGRMRRCRQRAAAAAVAAMHKAAGA